MKKILPQTIKSEVSFIDEIKNFDIVTEKMNDSFYTYRLESNVMIMNCYYTYIISSSYM